MSRGTIRRMAIALMVGGVLLVTYPAVSGGMLWDLGATCGYICLISFVCLYVFPVRGDGLPHARLLGLSQHKSLGWCVLATAIAHVAVVLLAEPQSTRYLLPSAPLFMWCGIGALLMLVALVITGLSARAQMRRRPAATVAAPRSDDLATSRGANSGAGGVVASRAADTSRVAAVSPATPRDGSQAAASGGPHAAAWSAGTAGTRATVHIVLAAVLVLMASAHIVGSSQLLSGPLKLVVVLLMLALPLGWYALRPRPAQNGGTGPSATGHAPGPGAPGRAVSGRATGHAPGPGATGRSTGLGVAGRALGTAHSLTRPASHIAAVAIIALMPAPVSRQLLLEPVVRPSSIAVSFPHDSHTSVSCVACHHNYVDHTGTTACLECHRSARADLVHSSESTFHTFCRDCHTQLALGSVKHGPTRSCSACHQGIRSNNL